MKIKKIDEIYAKIRATLIAKNHDYANSFHYLYKEYGLESVIIRLDDKISRLKTINKKARYVKDERVKDTLMDVVGCSLLALNELEDARKEKYELTKNEYGNYSLKIVEDSEGEKSYVDKPVEVFGEKKIQLINRAMYSCPYCGWTPQNKSRKYKEDIIIPYFDDEWSETECPECHTTFSYLIV